MYSVHVFVLVFVFVHAVFRFLSHFCVFFHIFTLYYHFRSIPYTKFRLFQHEDWSDAVPSLVTPVQDVVDKVTEQCAKLKRKENVWRVLEQSGADLFWDEFPASFLTDLNTLGDGSRFYRASVQKLKKSATSSPIATVSAEPKEYPKPCIRQVVKSSIHSSYMPSALVPVVVGSLVAVDLTEARCKELKLDKAFVSYIPLIAKVCRLIDSVTYECSWMESQKLGGESCPDGLAEGYAGSWRDWIMPNGEAAPTTILKASDVYACNFLLLPKTAQMCVPLRDFLKQALAQRRSVV